MFITNARTATIYSLLAKTDPTADPPHKGMSCFAAEKGPGLTVSRDIDKLGYKGIETCEVNFEDYRVPAANLIGGEEGHGLQHGAVGARGRPHQHRRARRRRRPGRVRVRRSATPSSARPSASRSASTRRSS